DGPTLLVTIRENRVNGALGRSRLERCVSGKLETCCPPCGPRSTSPPTLPGLGETPRREYVRRATVAVGRAAPFQDPAPFEERVKERRMPELSDTARGVTILPSANGNGHAPSASGLESPSLFGPGAAADGATAYEVKFLLTEQQVREVVSRISGRMAL